tara:strand:- start:172 stop:561 length:390 start_codon:yes stop_codon:yes gene_type:complete
MIYTHIDGIPVFSTKYEAMEVGFKTYGLQGFHVHQYNGRTGYMYGASHAEIKEAVKNKETKAGVVQAQTSLNVIPSRTPNRALVRQSFLETQETIVQPVERPLPRTTTTRVTRVGSSGGGGYSGGGGGY